MATVIKSTLGARTAMPIAFSFADVAQHADQYVADVQAKAAAIVADAQRQATEVTHRAESDGRQAAMQAVERVLDEKVGKRMETLLPALEHVISDLSDAKQAWLRHWEESAIRLSARIAERVIRRELKHSPEIVLALVQEALELAVGSPQIKISLSPDDFETLGGQVQNLTQQIARIAKADIVADATVSPGGCRAETSHGVVDQQIESQLERIVGELIGD